MILLWLNFLNNFLALHLEKIILTNFKNYAARSFEFNAKLNAFVGLNGVGKTNVLDAVYFLCVCKSYFLNIDSDLILRGGDFFRLEGHFNRAEKKQQIVAKVQVRKRKVFEKNSVPYPSLSEHIGFLPVVMIAPDDIELVREGSEERRKFLDIALCQIDNQYLTQLNFYNKLLEQRNATLKQQAQISREACMQLLDIYDTQMQGATNYIFEKRRIFIENFEPIFNKFYEQISNDREKVICRYESQLNEMPFLKLMQQNRQRDLVVERTFGGIHRDNLGFEMNGVPLKKFGSQGQTKSFVVALKLAQYELLTKGIFNNNIETPILLLDDIFDKLDEQRVLNLLKLIENQAFGQIFLTDTSPERVANIVENLGIDATVFHLDTSSNTEGGVLES